MGRKSNKRITFAVFMSALATIIQSGGFLNRSRIKPQDFTRNRKMPFSKLIFFMLNTAKSSIQTRLDNFFENVLKENVHMSQQSFSDARQKIKHTAFLELFAAGVSIIYDGYYDTWNGYRLSAIDGSKMQLPDDPKLRRFYGTMGADNSAATAQASALYDVLNNVLIDVRIAPLRTDEMTLAMRHIDTLCSLASFIRECILWDRGYASFELIETLKNRGISFVMRVKRGFSKAVDQLKHGDHTVALQKRGHEDIRVRVLKFELSSGEEETLITDIVDASMGIEDFKKLYFMRWGVETKYDELKNKLQVENFSGRTPKAIVQDFYCSMIMSNAVAVACWDAQQIVDEQREDKDNKYEYHVNVNHAIGVFKDRFIRAMLETNPRKRAREAKRILFLLTKNAVPTRPDRSVPRNKAPRRAKFRHNRKANC